MAKIYYTGSTPLDGAIADFLSRIVADGKQLSYMTGFSFIREVGAGHKVTITFFADEELAQFGKTPKACPACNEVHDPPYSKYCKAAPITGGRCSFTWETRKGNGPRDQQTTAWHECRIQGTHVMHKCEGCSETYEADPPYRGRPIRDNPQA